MIEQLSLFDEKSEWHEVGMLIIEKLNTSDTLWKNYLIMTQEEYKVWDYPDDIKKNIKTYSFCITDKRFKENYYFMRENNMMFTYYDYTKEESEKLNDCLYENVMNKLKSFNQENKRLDEEMIQMFISPTLIHVIFRQCENVEPKTILNLIKGE